MQRIQKSNNFSLSVVASEALKKSRGCCSCSGTIHHCHIFSYEENVSILSVFTILYGLLDHLEPKEDSTSNTKVIRDFKEILAPQIVQRFELHSLYSAHLLLIGSLLDPRFKSITLSKFKGENEIKKLKQALIELMETE